MVALAICALLVACNSSNSSDSGGSTTVAPTESQIAPITQQARNEQSAATDPARTDPVGRLLLDTMSNDFIQQDDDLAGTGPKDLAAAAADDGAADAVQFLEGVGFVRGYQRLWTTQDFRSTIYLHLTVLGSDDGAVAYCGRLAENFRRKATTLDEFTVSDVPGAVGLRGGASDGAASAVFASRGPRCVEVLVGGTTDIPAAEQIAQVSKLFVQQYAKV